MFHPCDFLPVNGLFTTVLCISVEVTRKCHAALLGNVFYFPKSNCTLSVKQDKDSQNK